MTKEEFNKILDEILPAIVGGVVRPDMPIPTDLEFCTEFRQLLQADMNLANHENAFLRQIFSNDKVIMALIEAIKNQLASCDLRIVTTTLKGLMSPEMLKKLNDIQEGATNYTHPATHPATVIALDALHRFVTDTQINSWNNKADSIHGTHVPAPQTANNAKYLRNDNTWQTVTPGDIGAAPATHTHSYAGSSSTGGAANSATKLATPRTITIGETSKTFDGTANLTWTLDEIGASMSTGTAPTLTPIIDWDAMNTAVGGSTGSRDVRNINNTDWQIKAYGGDDYNTNSGNDRPFNKGDIIFKQSVLNFDAILVTYTSDSGDLWWDNLIPNWILQRMLNTTANFDLTGSNSRNQFWHCLGANNNVYPTRRSSATRFYSNTQDCGIIEIYGVTY